MQRIYVLALALLAGLFGCGADDSNVPSLDEPTAPRIEMAAIADGGVHEDTVPSPFLTVLGTLDGSATTDVSHIDEPSRLTTVRPTAEFLALYGNEAGNDYFQKQSRVIVAHAENHIRKLVEHFRNKDKLKSKGFYKHLGDLGKARRDIAVQTNSPSMHEFGLPRNPLWAPHLITPVSPKVYPRLHEKALEDLRGELERLRQGGLTVSAWKEDLNRDSRVRAVLLPYDRYFPGAEAYADIHSRYQHGDREYGDRWIEGRMFLYLCGVKQPSSLTQPELADIARRASEQDMRIAKTEVEINVDGEYIPLFNVRVGVFSKPKLGEEGLQSLMLVQHPRSDHVGSLVRKSGQLWQEAVDWHGTEPRELMEKIAKLHYVLDNAVSFVRGSAAITEWLSEGLYQYHGYRPFLLRSEHSHSIVQEAMGTMSMAEFVAKYLEIVTVVTK